MLNVLSQHEWLPCWRFERCELAVKHGQGHEVPRSFAHMIAQDLETSIEEDEPEWAARFLPQPVSVRLLKG